ncbi:MAG: ferrous iron transport protein B [Desulfurococcales archaeon]|nr:ferrous iron transport protein B [Desulfurococcales archaeon]
MALTAKELGWLEKGLSGCSKVYALVGAPNTGKSTLFNVLTGGKARVGNWPGVTVSVSVGRLDGVCLVDVPGVYGLGSVSLEERVTREFFLRVPVDGVLVLIDATVPERSFYLLVTLLEALRKPAAIVVTKIRLAHGLGVHIDLDGLSRALGLPVIATSALEGVGVEELRDALRRGVGARPSLRVDYGVAEEAVEELEGHPDLRAAEERLGFTARWLAAQLLADDEQVKMLLESMGFGGVVEEAERLAEQLRERTGIEPSLLIAQARVRVAEDLASAYVVRKKPRGSPAWLDRIFRHPIWGPLAGLGLLFAVFLTAFSVNTGFPLNVIIAHWSPGAAAALEEYSLGGLISRGFEALKSAVVPLLPQGAIAGSVAAVIDGVGLVSGFIPLVGTIVALTAVVEDSGLFTRMAVAFHPIVSRFGLSGRSVYPLALGTGCNVPAVLSTRILDPVEKVRAIMAIPFIPCSARFIVISIFVSAFFHSPLTQALAATGIYATGILVALATARLTARWQVHRYGGAVEEEPPLVMELPPLHPPSGKVVWWVTREALLEYMKKIGGPILLGALVVWALIAYGPHGYTQDPTASFAYYLGRAIGVLFEPIGVGSAHWVLGLAALAGAVAKEIFADTIAVTMGTPEPSRAVAALGLTPAQAYAVLVFVALYIPCVATFTAMVSELKERRLALFYVLYSTTIATILMYASYAALRLAGIP